MEVVPGYNYTFPAPHTQICGLSTCQSSDLTLSSGHKDETLTIEYQNVLTERAAHFTRRDAAPIAPSSASPTHLAFKDGQNKRTSR